MGDTGSPYHVAYFGRRFGVTPPAYQLALVQMYATNVLIEAAQFITLRSVLDINVISEAGAVVFTSQSGSMTFNSVTDMYFIQSGLTNVIKFAPGRYFNVSTTYVDFSVATIGNSIPTQPVRFQDSDGVSFNNTFIFNGGTANQTLDCNVTGALIVNDDLVINGNLTVRGYIFNSDSYQDCPMPMVPSDARVKRDVQHAEPANAYERITRMPLKTFRYTEEYLKTPGRPPHLTNGTYVGVIAQVTTLSFPLCCAPSSRVAVPICVSSPSRLGRGQGLSLPGEQGQSQGGRHAPARHAPHPPRAAVRRAGGSVAACSARTRGPG